MLSQFEQKILASLAEHVRFIDISIREMVRCIYASWDDNRKEEMMKALENAKEAEYDANRVKNKIIETISMDQSSLYRGDFLRLILQLDKIADFAEGVAARVTRFNFYPDEATKDKMKPLLEAILKMGDIFKRTIKSLTENKQKTLELCGEIDKVEEETDRAYRSLESFLMQSLDGGKLPISAVLQLLSVTKQIEDAGDLCQEAADHIRILLASL